MSRTLLTAATSLAVEYYNNSHGHLRQRFLTDLNTGQIMAVQGYQIIATGHDRYITMAAACAASLRIFDGKRRIQLVTDRSLEALSALGYEHLFDDLTRLSDDAGKGAIVKLHAYESSIYDQTMFVDADCLLLKHDIDNYWSTLSNNYEVSMPGEWRSSGEWYGMSITDMCEIASVSRLVQMNSGAIFFKKGVIGKHLFETARAIYATFGNITGHVHHGVGASDEPYLGLAMGALALDPFPLRDEHCNSWMTATMNSLAVYADATSGQTALVKKLRTVSPSLCHFTNLYPRDLYDQVAGDLLRKVFAPAV